MAYSPAVTRFAQTFQTTNNTPVVAYSVPIPAGSASRVDLDFAVTTATFSNAASGSITVTFRRQAAGNVVRSTGNGGLLNAALTIIGDFITSPNIEVVANTSNQTADIRLTGLSATTLNWRFTANVRKLTD